MMSVSQKEDRVQVALSLPISKKMPSFKMGGQFFAALY